MQRQHQRPVLTLSITKQALLEVESRNIRIQRHPHLATRRLASASGKADANPAQVDIRGWQRRQLAANAKYRCDILHQQAFARLADSRDQTVIAGSRRSLQIHQQPSGQQRQEPDPGV